MPMSALISVIVPVYKVEPYLHRCVESILKQTYTNLEIILVDDGSPDKCGEICDELASTDKRIQVIHQKNKGLSGARNSGLNIATGEYIAFVDSDDCLHPEMYKRLYEDICLHNVKLAFCQANMCHGEVIKVTCNQPTVCKEKNYVMYRSLSESIWWAAWTKLYHRSLLENIRFPEGRTNEDYAVMMLIYDQCEQIAINFNRLYNYCIRENSICTSSLNIHKFDQLISAEEVLIYIKERHPEFKKFAEAILMSSCLGLLHALHKEDKKKDFTAQEKEIYQLIQKYFSTAIWNNKILTKQRILLLAARIHPTIYKRCITLYEHIKNQKK